MQVGFSERLTTACFGETLRHREATKEVIGKSVAQAEEHFQKHFADFSIHVVWEDGMTFGGPKNIDWDRLNVGVENGIIVKEWNRQGNMRDLLTWG